MNQPTRIPLVRMDGGPDGTTINITLLHYDDGSIVLRGFDTGAAPSQMFGRDEYEYVLTIAATEVPRVLIGLLTEHLSGDLMAVSKCQNWLETRGIPHEFETS